MVPDSWIHRGVGCISHIQDLTRWISLSLRPQTPSEKLYSLGNNHKTYKCCSLLRDASSAMRIEQWATVDFRCWECVFLCLLKKARKAFPFPAAVFPSCSSYEQAKLKATAHHLPSTRMEKGMPLKDHLEFIRLW